MAQLAANPWQVKSTDTLPLTIAKGFVKIKQIEFESYSVATDTCEIDDISGNVVWMGHGDTSLETVRSGEIGWVQGVVVKSVASGNVVIYFM